MTPTQHTGNTCGECHGKMEEQVKDHGAQLNALWGESRMTRNRPSWLTTTIISGLSAALAFTAAQWVDSRKWEVDVRSSLARIEMRLDAVEKGQQLAADTAAKAAGQAVAAVLNSNLPKKP